MSIIKWLDKKFEFTILAILLAILTILSFMNVIMRYGFGGGLSWSDEVCRYSLVLSGFFSMPCWIRYRTGIRVDAVVMLFPGKVRTALSYVCNILMIGFLFVLCWGSLEVIKTTAKIHQTSPALRLPMVYMYVIMGFTFALSIVRYVQTIVLDLKAK